MIKIFAGEDNYESYNAVKKDAEKSTTETNTELKSINASEISDISQLTQYFEGTTFFSNGYTVILKRISENKKVVDYIEQYYDQLNQYNIFIWESSKADQRGKLVKKVKGDGQLFSFELPKFADFRNWITKKGLDYGLKLTTSNITTLVERSNNSKFLLDNVLNKLALYLKVEKKNILSDDEIIKLMGFDAEGDIWRFLESFSNKDLKKTLNEYEKLMLNDGKGQYLIAMLTSEVSNIFKYKYFKEKKLDTSTLGIHPFVLRKLQDKVSNFTLAQLGKMLQNLFQADWNIKSGKMDEYFAVYFFLLENV